LQAKGYHDHPKPESKTPSELRKVTASYKRKLIDKRRSKTAVLSRLRPDAAEREDLFRFPLGAGACSGGTPLAAGEETEHAPGRGELVLNTGDCGNGFKCSGCKYELIISGQFMVGDLAQMLIFAQCSASNNGFLRVCVE